MTTTEKLDTRKDEITALVTVARIPKAGDNRQAARPAKVDEKAGYQIAGALVVVLVLVPLVFGWLVSAASWVALAGERSDYAQAYEARLAALAHYENETGEAYSQGLPPKATDLSSSEAIAAAVELEGRLAAAIRRDVATHAERQAQERERKEKAIAAYVRAWKETQTRQGVFRGYAEDQLRSFDRQWARSQPETLAAAKAEVERLKAEK